MKWCNHKITHTSPIEIVEYQRHPLRCNCCQQITKADWSPDNNLAERALRLAVTKRKVSGGSRSMARFQDTANILSTIQTRRFQGRSVVDFFASALQGQAKISVKPSLIPNT